MPPRHYDQARYDLMRVAYDPATGRFGPRETVLSSQATGLSILLPRPSPDGRFLLFCMCRYGCFPVFQPSSDLYLLDLRTGKHRRLEINSDRSESWHSWSSNGRGLVFSSKRAAGVFTRPYVSYVDAAGKVSRPFVLPQQDPEFYDSCLNAYSVPELVCEPVRVGMRQLVRAARSKGGEKARMPVLSMTAKKPAGASKGDANESPWKAAPAR